MLIHSKTPLTFSATNKCQKQGSHDFFSIQWWFLWSIVSSYLLLFTSKCKIWIRLNYVHIIFWPGVKWEWDWEVWMSEQLQTTSWPYLCGWHWSIVSSPTQSSWWSKWRHRLRKLSHCCHPLYIGINCSYSVGSCLCQVLKLNVKTR